jgi:ABC-type antimicrobial peptide transport system permease subunit
MAKARVTRFAKQGGTGGGPVETRSVVASYVAAHGGAASATGGAIMGRAAARRLGGFLAAVAERGLTSALEEQGLTQLVGRDSADVLSGLVDQLAGPGRTLEEAAARAAMIAVLAEEFDEAAFDDIDAAMRRLDEAATKRILGAFLIEYIYRRMVEEIGDRIQNGALDAAAASRVERDLHDFLCAAVELDLSSVDPLRVDWQGGQGQTLIDSLMEDAYGQLD